MVKGGSREGGPPLSRNPEHFERFSQLNDVKIILRRYTAFFVECALANRTVVNLTAAANCLGRAL